MSHNSTATRFGHYLNDMEICGAVPVADAQSMDVQDQACPSPSP